MAVLKDIGPVNLATPTSGMKTGLPRRTADHKTNIGAAARSPVVFPHQPLRFEAAYRQLRAGVSLTDSAI
jgi:hypothetical protein